MKIRDIISKVLPGVLFLFFITACAPRLAIDNKYISDKIKDKSGFSLPDEFSDSLALPPGVLLEDGLNEDEAVSIALWNSPQLIIDLTALGFAQADLAEARMLPNPVFSLLFPLGPKQMEFTLIYYAEVLWQRPGKVAIAELNMENVAENLVQHGLAMIRDVSTSYADVVKDMKALDLLESKAKIDVEIAEIASMRVASGDISELEETAFRLSASQAREAAILAKKNLETQNIRFRTLLGLISDTSEIKIVPAPVKEFSVQDPDTLIKIALACRPDMRAAEIAIESAGKKMGWERSKIFNLTAILDANAEGKEGFEMGPGMQFPIPIFNFNKGGRIRAQTEIQKAGANYIVVQQSIRSQVLQSYYDYLASKSTFEILSNEIAPIADEAVINAESAYLAGELSYLEFLEFERQNLNVRLRLCDTEANLRKTQANLFFSTGGKLSLQWIEN